MTKRKYTHIKETENVIISLREAGLTRQEIADELGLQKSQIKDWVRRYNQRREQLRKGMIPKRTGRPRKHTSQAYFKLTQSYGITPSMSRKGNPYDNAMAENFFSILKTECIYRHRPKTFREANDLIDRYIHFYNHERIQNKTGVAPLTLRHSA